MVGYRREYYRFNVSHLDFIKLTLNECEFDIYDLSLAGFSFVNMNQNIPLAIDSTLKNLTLNIGPIKLTLDLEVVFLSEEDNLTGVRIIKYYEKSLKLLSKFLKYVEASSESNKISVNKNDDTWTIKSNSFTLQVNQDDFLIINKSLLTVKDEIPFAALAYVSAAPYKHLPINEILKPILKEL